MFRKGGCLGQWTLSCYILKVLWCKWNLFPNVCYHLGLWPTASSLFLNFKSQKEIQSSHSKLSFPPRQHFLKSYFFLSFGYTEGREGVITPGTGVKNACELPCGCWEQNPGPWEEQELFSTPTPHFSTRLVSYDLQCFLRLCVLIFLKNHEILF